MEDDLLTTGDVARYCQVSPVTVFRWVKNGKLKAYTTPGGHYRIRKGDFHDFLEESGMPILEDFFESNTRRVLIASKETETANFIAKSLRESQRPYEVITATDTIEAGLQLALFKPELVILDAALAGTKIAHVCQIMKSKSPVPSLKILLISEPSQGQAMPAEHGADDCLCPPISTLDLQNKVHHLLNGHK
ncbi:MAG: helix-turn-helix domain-containing protein [Anaerolineae bacterium]|nr:helix-turn-helix domain-containing protein [Anaerolineae bacterium]